MLNRPPMSQQFAKRGPFGAESAFGNATRILFIATSVNVGKLRVRWQAADKLQRTSGSEAYETAAREMYGLLRETWEKAVSEVLLNDVVERYRPSIETQKLRHLHDIMQGDIEIAEKAMTECSRWIRGHDHPARTDVRSVASDARK